MLQKKITKQFWDPSAIYKVYYTVKQNGQTGKVNQW